MPAYSLRWWLLLGAAGLVLLWLIQPLHSLWVINEAGIAINKAAIAQQGEGREQDASSPDPLLAKAMGALEDMLPSTNPSDAAERLRRQILRTYGAAAALAPSEHAFQQLLAAHRAGKLDRFGELRLGQVASALGHWEEAREAYQRIDATNLLVSTADNYLEHGETAYAVHFYLLAQASLEAALKRADLAETLAVDRSLASHQPLSAATAERVNTLLRIGRGLLSAQQPDLAAMALEKGLALAQNASPGNVAEQSLRLTLAQALAQSLGRQPVASYAVDSFSYFPDPKVIDFVLTQARIRALIQEATRIDLTARTCVSAARALLLIGDYSNAVSLLVKAIQLDPLQAEGYLVLGAWYEEQGLIGLARQVYTQGKEKLPADVQIVQAYALVTYRCLPAEEALSALQDAVDKGSRDPYVFAFLGDCYKALGMKQKAAEAYLDGISSAGGIPPLLDRLARLFGPPDRSP
ncbi:MAG: hypothetical protein N3B14_03565 [Thermoleophilia bacterium]|nr:hypothetical protein [Thermoleophilia bacterium]